MPRVLSRTPVLVWVLFLISSLTLVLVVPNEISSHGRVLDSVHELCTRHNQEGREAVAIASSNADALQHHSPTMTAVIRITHNN